MRTLRSPQFRIVFFYLVAGFLWIYFSDKLIHLSAASPTAITALQNIKGWAFITFTGILLFFLIKRDFDALSAANREIIRSYEQTIRGWIRVMDMRHRETMHHTERVTRATLELAKLMGITDEEVLKHIEQGAILHDVGKVGIPDSILLKPDKLDDEEWEIMRQHPVIAHEILSKITYLGPCIDIPYCHHEKWDGTGYPRGIRGEEIPISARIFAVIDVWDALRHARVYKPEWKEEDVLAHIEGQSGKHFDPAVVTTFLEHYDTIKSAAENISKWDCLCSPIEHESIIHY
jgi:response regulator RpfG family c-di-GMP phosphodiesterase